MDEIIQQAKSINFYKEKLKNIKHFQELVERRFFTYKKDLAQSPMDFLQNFPSKYSLIFSSSGTTNMPTLSFYSEEDINIIDYLGLKVMKRLEVNEKDVGLINVPLELIMPGYCMERMLLLSKAVCVPAGAFILNPNKLWEIIKRLGVTVYMGYPSALMEIIENNLKELSGHSLRMAIMGAEPLSDKRRKQFENILGIDIYDSWGMSEIFAPLGGECKYKRGNHLTTDVVYPEIINPETKEPVIPHNGKAEGILVLTTLKRDGMPLIRYWTNDFVILDKNPCPCGENSPTMRIKDKFDFMIKLDRRNLSTLDFDNIILSDNIWEYLIDFQKRAGSFTLKITIEAFKGKKISNDELYEIDKKLRSVTGIQNLEIRFNRVNWLGIKRIKPKRKRVKVYER